MVKTYNVFVLDLYLYKNLAYYLRSMCYLNNRLKKIKKTGNVSANFYNTSEAIYACFRWENPYVRLNRNHKEQLAY